jgi:myo-inositol 2-dehydrogenase / D-chiro-inositol 1-dehydrogenase
MSEPQFDLSRRGFLLTSASAALAGLSGCAMGDRGTEIARRPAGEIDEKAAAVRARDGARLRVGVIGCGYRGSGAALDAVAASPSVEIVALGDLFRDRLDEARKLIVQKAGPACTVSDERCFTGFDNHHKVLAAGVDLVILAAPPGFRPMHLAAAVEAGKHVFMEKPVAVDPPGVRSVIASSQAAEKKSLGIVAGTQRRHQPHYIEAMKRIHDGQIGEIVAAQCYWNQGELWVKKKEPAWSEMEWQCRNWLYFTWLSGDHLVEQHVHNLDVVNWALRANPLKCVGMGGRQARVEPEFGNVYDHFAVEFEYPGGVRTLSQCRQIKGSSHRVAERIVGTRGVAYLNATEAKISGARPWTFSDEKLAAINPYVQEHADLVDSIRSGTPLNEGRRIAESTLTAIMGRMSAYTGKELQWEWIAHASKLDLSPPTYTLGPLPVDAVAVPGQTHLL